MKAILFLLRIIAGRETEAEVERLFEGGNEFVNDTDVLTGASFTENEF